MFEVSCDLIVILKNNLLILQGQFDVLSAHVNAAFNVQQLSGVMQVSAGRIFVRIA